MRRPALLAALAAVAVVAVVSATMLPRLLGGTGASLPASTPPPVFTLGSTEQATPGRVELAVTLTDPDTSEIRPAYVVPAGGGPVSRVGIPPEALQNLGSEIRLSSDGTRLTYLEHSGVGAITVQDLVTGDVRTMGNDVSAFAEVSPDDSTLAVVVAGGVELRSLAGGGTRDLPGLSAGADHSRLGWSPDGRLLAVDQDGETLVVALDGSERTELGAGTPVNGSMSWSPDGRSVLLYDSVAGATVVARLDGSRTSLDRPTGAVRALGWAGDRVVWLLQDPADPARQRLVTTDRSGADQRTWMRFDVGDRLVETVSWSDDLRGGPQGAL